MNRIFVAGSVALCCVGALSVSLTEAQAGKKRVRFQNEKDLIVTLVTPTLNQEVLPDLSDPGVNGVVTVHFSGPIRRKDVINNQNAFNRLTSKVEFFDATFARLPGTPRVRRNRLIFNPRTAQNFGMLPQGQYTLNVKRTLRNRRGRLLNFGKDDFTTTFSVGTDVYAPVLRKIAPIDGQTNIGLQQPITASFNEPIDPSTIISTIQVQDASTNPPAAIPGLGGASGVSLARNGFDVVFRPDPCFGYPPQTTVQFLMQGIDAPSSGGPTASPVTDQFGNAFRRDSGLQWTLNAATNLHESPNGSYDEVTGTFRMQFQTKGVKPPPAALPPGSPQFPFTPFCTSLVWAAPRCYNNSGRVFFYTTGNAIGEVDLTRFITRFNQGVTDFSRIEVLANSPVRVGRPLGVMTDPRFDVNQGFHTFVYVVDQRTASVAVLDSRNLSVLGRFQGFAAPRDIAIGVDFGLARPTAYITDFASNQVVVLDLSAITVDFSGQPGAPSVCDTIKDQQSRRQIVQVGRGPTSIASDTLTPSRVGVVNTLDSSFNVINGNDNSLRGTYETGSNPVDCDWSMIGFGGIDVCMIANQGGLTDPDGSVSMYINSPPIVGLGFPGAAQTRDGVEATLNDNIKNPTNVWGNQQWINPFSGNSFPSITWFVANTGGKDVTQLQLSLTGLFGIAISPNIVATHEVGFNPTRAMFDPYYPNAFLFASVAGTGEFAGMDPTRPVPPTFIRVPGIRRIDSCYSH